MVILSLLALLLSGSFTTTLKRGRDAQRKNDLSQIQKALEIYYEDERHYPTFDIFSAATNSQLCTTEACAPTETKYMIKVSKDPTSSTYKYSYEPTGTYYYLYSYIENEQDQGAGVSITGFTNDAKCNEAGDVVCRYYVMSSNATPLTPKP